MDLKEGMSITEAIVFIILFILLLTALLVGMDFLAGYYP